MPYCIIETDQGLTIAELQSGRSAEEAAEMRGATLIDAGPYHDFDEADDALTTLQAEMSEEGAESDVPGARPLEGREED